MSLLRACGALRFPPESSLGPLILSSAPWGPGTLRTPGPWGCRPSPPGGFSRSPVGLPGTLSLSHPPLPQAPRAPA